MNTTPKIPAPDPAVIAHYAVHVLGVQLADWQHKALIDCVQGFGYASVAWADQITETEEPEPRAWTEGDAQPRDNANAGLTQPPQPTEMRKGYNTGPAPAHPRTDTPIGDALPDPRGK